MKTLKYPLIAVSLALTLSACSDDDNATSTAVPASVQASYNNMYTSGQNAVWQQKSSNAGNVYKVEFDNNTVEYDAYYKTDGTWLYTEEDVKNENLSTLPTAVQNAFNATSYSKTPWIIDDIDIYTLNNVEVNFDGIAGPIYNIEVEDDATGNDWELRFDQAGNLIDQSENLTDAEDIILGGLPSSGNGNNSGVPSAVLTQFSTMYPQAVGADWDQKLDGAYEVDFELSGVSQEAHYRPDGTWIYTEKEIAQSALPQSVQDAFNASTYSKSPWILDEIDSYEINNAVASYNGTQGIIYDIEVENNTNQDYQLRFDDKGNIVDQGVNLGDEYYVISK